MKINDKIVEFATLGGSLLGGGGGGSMKEGKQIGKMAVKIGNPAVIDIEDLPDDATIITVSAVGAPAAREQYIEPMDYVKAIEILKRNGVRIDGIITCENGGFATVNGWFQSAVLNIPVVDAPCDGRAHPMGIMGSMGLHKIEEYVSKQAAVGGEKGRHLEIYTSGNLDRVSRIIRQAAVFSGGMVAVARNPAGVDYVRKSAAVGAITQAIELGRTMKEATSSDGMIEKALRCMGGEKIGEGIVKKVKVETTEGFDVGIASVKAMDETYELTFWNEYMCIEKSGQRMGTFPDLIATVNLETGLPLTTAEIKKGQKVAILRIPKENLKLGLGLKDSELFREVEKITGKEIIKYVR